MAEGEERDLVQEANEAAERLERANEVRRELLAREERLEVNRKLGGRSEGGVVAEPKKKLTDEEFAEKLVKGEVNLYDESN